MEHTCQSCGADGAYTYVCHFCGTPIRPLNDADSQLKALDELHAQLAKKGTDSNILASGFIPDDPRVLIEAGLRLFPVLENAAGQSAAAGRLRAITFKLKLVASDDVAKKACQQFEDALTRYQRSDRLTGIGVISVLLLSVGALAALIWWLVR